MSTTIGKMETLRSIVRVIITVMMTEEILIHLISMSSALLVNSRFTKWYADMKIDNDICTNRYQSLAMNSKIVLLIMQILIIQICTQILKILIQKCWKLIKLLYKIHEENENLKTEVNTYKNKIFELLKTYNVDLQKYIELQVKNKKLQVENKKLQDENKDLMNKCSKLVNKLEELQEEKK